MNVYVDAAIHRWRGQNWCHLFCLDIDKLHDFAAGIGMQRRWFQNPHDNPSVSWPHYDINESRRRMALAAGAVPLRRPETIAISRIIKNRYFGLEGTAKAHDPVERYRTSNPDLSKRLEMWLAAETAPRSANALAREL